MAFVPPVSVGGWRWFPWAIVAAFLLVLAVNGTMVYFAIGTSPGVVSDHPFELGNGYNEVLAKGAAQDSLHWRGRIAYAHGDLRIALADGAAKPLVGLTLTAEIIRPVEDLPVIPVKLSSVQPGLYVAALALPKPGQWDVRVTAKRGRDVYQFRQRIDVP